MNKSTQALTEVSHAVIAMMNEHGSNWVRPWKDAVRESGMPVSAKKRPYSGINRLTLGLTMATREYSSPVFGTYKQWASLGAKLKDDARGKSIKVFFFKRGTYEDKETGEAKVCFNSETFHVWNSEHVENWDGNWLDEDVEEHVQEWADLNDVDQFIESLGANINVGKARSIIFTPSGTSTHHAYYSPSTDTIQMPSKAQFPDAATYYGTLFHELAHWTGHETRENRKLGSRFGSDRYAFEELVAELASAMLSGITGVDATPREDHAIYLNNWIACLKDDPKAIQKAASLAEKAAQFILNNASTEHTTERAA